MLQAIADRLDVQLDAEIREHMLSRTLFAWSKKLACHGSS